MQKGLLTDKTPPAAVPRTPPPHRALYPALSMLLLCIFALSLSRIAPAQTTGDSLAGLPVESVRVSGNRIVTDNQILARVRIRPGDIFNPQTAEKDAARIAELTEVTFAYYNAEARDAKVILTFVVGERNIIRRISFEGNKAYGDNTLKTKIGLNKSDPLDAFLAEQGRRQIADFYRSKGYAFAEVSLSDEAIGRGEVLYEIDEGPRVEVIGLRFRGNEGLKADQLKKIVKTKPSLWFLWRRYYNREKTTADVDRLLAAYDKKGYLDAEVTAAEAFSDDRSRVVVTFNIDEGPLYIVEHIVISGNTSIDDRTCLDAMRLKTGHPYSRTLADIDARKIESLYRARGFIDASVEHRRIFTADDADAPGRIRAEFVVTEGRQFRIGRVNIIMSGPSGTPTKTQDKVVRRVLDEYDFKPGQLYNADIAEGTGAGELEKAVRRKALMDSAAITPLAAPDPNQRDAQVSVIEGRTGMIMLGAGVDSSAGLIGQLIFEQRNFDISDWPETPREFIRGEAFKGAGQRLRLSFEPGTELTQYALSFTEPYLHDQPLSLDVVASRYIRIRESYDETRNRVYLGFEKREESDWRKGISFRVEDVELDDLENDAPPEVLDLEGSTLLAGVRFSIGKNTTHDEFNPADGYEATVSYEQVGGDDAFGLLEGVYRRYDTVAEDIAGRKTILSTRIRAGTTIGEAPLFEKFYLGGIGSLRGFDYRGVSPRSGPSDDPIGSDWMALAGSELAVPLVGENLFWLLFFDSGTVETGPYRISAGTGIQILIPQWFGPVPMKFELAAPVTKDDQDETRAFSFSIGRLF